MPYGERPPDPDHVAKRGTDQYREAVHQLHIWVANNLVRGVPLEELVERWGEEGSTREGRSHHDWDEWMYNPPAEYEEALWNVGDFRRQANQGDVTEWPPGSGHFFNDPGNDPNKRVWFDQYGDRDPTMGPGDGPDIDYNDPDKVEGETLQQYLLRNEEKKKKEAEYRKLEDKAKPILPGPTGPPVGGSPPSNQVPPVGPPASAQRPTSALGQRGPQVLGGGPTGAPSPVSFLGPPQQQPGLVPQYNTASRTYSPYADKNSPLYDPSMDPNNVNGGGPNPTPYIGPPNQGPPPNPISFLGGPPRDTNRFLGPPRTGAFQPRTLRPPSTGSGIGRAPLPQDLIGGGAAKVPSRQLAQPSQSRTLGQYGYKAGPLNKQPQRYSRGWMNQWL